MTEQWVTTTDFIAIRPDGARVPLRVRIGKPYAASTEEWRCDVSLDGLYETLGPISAGDALQALGLALRLVGRLLCSFEEKGGRIEFDSGEPVPLSAYFGVSVGDVQPPGPGRSSRSA